MFLTFGYFYIVIPFSRIIMMFYFFKIYFVAKGGYKYSFIIKLSYIKNIADIEYSIAREGALFIMDYGD